MKYFLDGLSYGLFSIFCIVAIISALWLLYVTHGVPLIFALVPAAPFRVLGKFLK